MKASYAVGLALVAIALANSPVARADVFVSYHSDISNDYAYTNGSTSTLDTVTGVGAGTPSQILGALGLGSSFVSGGPSLSQGQAGITMTSSTTTAASGTQQTGWTGTITLTNLSGAPFAGVAAGGTIATIGFSNATLTNNGGGSYTLGGSATITPGAGLQLIANPTSPESFSLGLSGGGSGFTNFRASDSGNASATVQPVGTPEPSSMAIAAVGALGMIGYGLRRRKARTA
jgi:hypothetical protein